MRTHTTLAILILITGCTHRPPLLQEPTAAPQPKPEFKYRESTLMSRAAADKCKAENKLNPERCVGSVFAAEAAERVDQNSYYSAALFAAPVPRPSGYTSYTSYTGPSSAPTVFIEPRRGTSVTNYGSGAWSSQQGGTFCRGAYGSVVCY